MVCDIMRSHIHLHHLHLSAKDFSAKDLQQCLEDAISAFGWSKEGDEKLDISAVRELAKLYRENQALVDELV